MSLNFRTLRDYIASLTTVTPTGLDRFPLHDLSNPTDMSAATFDGVVAGVAADAALATDAELTAGLALKANLASPTFTGNVIVPDADADGEALAYDQLAAQVQSLNVYRSTFPSIVMRDTDLASNQRTEWYIGADGSLTCRSGTTGTEKTWMVVSPAGLVNMNHAGGRVQVPAAAASTDAAQVSAIDAATGRLAIGGYEVGTTGRRLVTATAGSGTIHLRRDGYFVHAVLTACSQDVSYALPPGFRPLGTTIAGGAWNTTLSTVWGIAASSATNNLTLTSGAATSTAWSGSLTWQTSNAWPASLPGSAA